MNERRVVIAISLTQTAKGVVCREDHIHLRWRLPEALKQVGGALMGPRAAL
jgi:hypothetical protein